MCPVLSAFLLVRYHVAKYRIVLEEMLCKSEVLIDDTAVMLINLLIRVHYTARAFKQQGELQGMDENILLPMSLKNY